jgi:hypothetical protein
MRAMTNNLSKKQDNETGEVNAMAKQNKHLVDVLGRALAIIPDRSALL